jgi:hypothetical protein
MRASIQKLVMNTNKTENVFTLLERDPKGVNDESEDSELEEDGALYTQISDEYKQNVIIFV